MELSTSVMLTWYLCTVVVRNLPHRFGYYVVVLALWIVETSRLTRLLLGPDIVWIFGGVLIFGALIRDIHDRARSSQLAKSKWYCIDLAAASDLDRARRARIR